MKALTASWEQAQVQLKTLRAQVERAGELADARLHAHVLDRDRDRALRILGEAVWQEVERGNLKLPEGMANALASLEALRQQTAAHHHEITDLLSQGEPGEAPSEKNTASKSGLAGQPKKR